jgi:hypothetical protein
MEPTTTRGNWYIDNRTGVIGHATRDFGIDLARCDTRTDLLAKLAYAFTKPWITDTERHDLVLLMAETCGVLPDDPWEASYAAEAWLETCAREARDPSGPPVGFVSVDRYIILD